MQIKGSRWRPISSAALSARQLAGSRQLPAVIASSLVLVILGLITATLLHLVGPHSGGAEHGGEGGVEDLSALVDVPASTPGSLAMSPDGDTHEHGQTAEYDCWARSEDRSSALPDVVTAASSPVAAWYRPRQLTPERACAPRPPPRAVLGDVASALGVRRI